MHESQQVAEGHQPSAGARCWGPEGPVHLVPPSMSLSIFGLRQHQTVAAH